jgi:signal transduction histidine kinase
MLLLNGKTDKEVLCKVDAKVKQVTNMIEEFFTLTKLESGDFLVDFSRVHCNEICKSSIIGFYDMLSEKGFDVDIDIPDQDIFAYADKVAVERVLNNLISNAVRYGYDGNFLQIKLYEKGNYVFIDVTDKGKGIDHIVSKRVFDRLYTVDDSRNKLVQGNGLGLTIAKQLSQKMEGDLTLESIPHVKTAFTLKLKKYEL